MQNKIISGYTISYLLGEGGMAEVWYAENSIGKPAAVKVLKEEFLKMKQVVERFENEARVMVKLNHPNIRQVYDYGTIDGRPCIAMEYLEGQDLSSRMKEGTRFEPKQLQQWWNQLIEEALDYTHRKEIVHRDIKPSNIFLTDDGEIKLLDFGIAKIKDSITVTKTGSRIGTLLYMSPEQVKDSKYLDYRSDIYSLAVTFYHLLTGVAPYDNTNSSDFEILTKIVNEPLGFKNIPTDWANFLKPYLEKDPDQRPALSRFEQSGRPVKKSIEEDTRLLESVNTGDDQKHVDNPSPTGYKSLLSIAVTVFVILLIGFIVFIIWENYPHSNQQQFTGIDKAETPTPSDLPTAAASHPATKTLQGVKLLLIRGGTFMMGSPESEPGRFEDETQHSVTLSNFYLSEKAITNEQYCRFLNAKGIPGNGQYNVSGYGNQTLIETHEWGVQYSNGEWRPASGKANFPVMNVRWYGAKAYCDWAGGRLPTEAEWEYACRAGMTTPFDTGNNLTTSQANYNGNYPYNNNAKGTHLGRTQPVGSYAPNAWGLYDMHGNVWEWCNDWYGDYSTGAVSNPQGPSSGSDRMLRGGGWLNDASDCRSASRSNYSPGARSNIIGFRLAASL